MIVVQPNLESGSKNDIQRGWVAFLAKGIFLGGIISSNSEYFTPYVRLSISFYYEFTSQKEQDLLSVWHF